MKKFTVLLFVAAFAVLAGADAGAQTSAPPTTDDAVSSISSIKRPSKATPAPASAGPKKGLQANLTTDEKSETPSTSFASTTPKIYLRWNDDSAAKDEKLRVVWYLEAKNKKLSEGAETMPGPGAFGRFYLNQPSGGFPAGKYRVSLYEGDKLAKSLTFTVVK